MPSAKRKRSDRQDSLRSPTSAWSRSGQVSWLQVKVYNSPLNRWSRLVAAYLLVRTDGPRIGRFSRDYVIAVVARWDFGDERGGDGDGHAGRP